MRTTPVTYIPASQLLVALKHVRHAFWYRSSPRAAPVACIQVETLNRNLKAKSAQARAPRLSVADA